MIKQLDRLFSHVPKKSSVDVGKDLSVWQTIGEISNSQPLSGEIATERARARIEEKSSGGCQKSLRLIQSSLSSRIHQRLIGCCSPEKIRQSSGQLMAVEVPDRSRACIRWSTLDAKNETR